MQGSHQYYAWPSYHPTSDIDLNESCKIQCGTWELHRQHSVKHAHRAM